MNDARRDHIQKQLQEIEAWRGKLSWEGRWRDLPQGKPLHYISRIGE
jgi:hypothetical protein